MPYGQLQWLEDTHIVTAAEVAAAGFGRAWNWESHRWESLLGDAYMTRGRVMSYHLRSVSIRVQNSSGADKRGILVKYGIVGDGQDTSRLIRLVGGLHMTTGHSGVHWQGDFPMGAGFYWKITEGGCAADEIVIARISYV